MANTVPGALSTLHTNDAWRWATLWLRTGAEQDSAGVLGLFLLWLFIWFIGLRWGEVVADIICLFVCCFWDKVLCIQSDPKLLIFLPQHMRAGSPGVNERSGSDAMPLPHVSVWPLVSNGSTHCCEDQGSALSQTLRHFFPQNLEATGPKRSSKFSSWSPGPSRTIATGNWLWLLGTKHWYSS